MRNKCAFCKYGVAVSGQQILACHRFPPTPMLIPVSGGVSLQFQWSVVGPNDFCGEFVEKPIVVPENVSEILKA